MTKLDASRTQQSSSAYRAPLTRLAGALAYFVAFCLLALAAVAAYTWQTRKAGRCASEVVS